MEYLHNEGDEQFLSLHDCRANRAELKEAVLPFWFEEGFWLLQTHPENPTGKTIRTGPSRVDYVLRNQDGDDVTAEIFTRLRWPHALRTSWELPKLLQAINEKGWGWNFSISTPAAGIGSSNAGSGPNTRSAS